MGNIQVSSQAKRLRCQYTKHEQKGPISYFDEQSIIQQEDVHINDFQKSPIRHRNKFTKGFSSPINQGGQSSRLRAIIRQVQNEKMNHGFVPGSLHSDLNPIKRTRKQDILPSKNVQTSRSITKISTQNSSARGSGRERFLNNNKSYSKFSNRMINQGSIYPPRNAYRRQNLHHETRLNELNQNREANKSRYFQHRKQNTQPQDQNCSRAKYIQRKVSNHKLPLANSQVYKKIKSLNEILSEVKTQLKNHATKRQQDNGSNLQNNINYGNLREPKQSKANSFNQEQKNWRNRQATANMQKNLNKDTFSFNFVMDKEQDIQKYKPIFVKELSKQVIIDKIEVSKDQADQSSNIIKISYDSSRFQSLKALSEDSPSKNQFPNQRQNKSNINKKKDHHRRTSSINSINSLFCQLQEIQNKQIKHQKELQQFLQNQPCNLFEDTDLTSISFSKQSPQRFN